MSRGELWRVDFDPSVGSEVGKRRPALIVGRDEGGRAFVAHQPQELGEHHVGGMLVEIAGRFVGEHQGGLIGKRAGDGDALLFAAGKLRRTVRQPMPQPQRGEQRFGAVVRGNRRRAADQLRQDDIFDRVEIRQQMVELIDEPQLVTPHVGAPRRIQLDRLDAGDADRAAEPAFE